MISKGNHVKFERLCCLPLVKKQNHDLLLLFRSVLNKKNYKIQFFDIQNYQGPFKGYQPQSSASADNPYLDLDNSGYHKNLIR